MSTKNADQNLMENLLILEKSGCDLYLHGTIESSTGNVQQSFKTALDDSLHMQERIYSEMASKGWYAPDSAEQNRVEQVKQKYCSCDPCNCDPCGCQG
ncbi:MAG: spore coat protein [Oscillospiraceae bacterium]|nr:spore coat protein [Oscillospiraceae bacterium]